MRPEPIEIAVPDGLRSRRERLFARASGNGFHAFKDSAETVIELFDEIGAYGVTEGDFRARLMEARGGDVLLKLNSPGGSVFSGLAIFNELVAYRGHVRVEIVGLAASIASIIALGGDEVAIAENAFIMVHRAWGITVGNEEDHTEQAGVLAKIDTALARTYANRTGATPAAMAKLMQAETWMDARQAKAGGFVTEIIGEAPIAARFDLGAFQNVPKTLAVPVEAAQIGSRAELERLLRERCGLARAAAKKVAAGGFGALSQPDSDADADAIRALIERVAAATAETTVRT